jgi:hypothetical protein
VPFSPVSTVRGRTFTVQAALNELHSLLMDRKDYPIGAYIHACSTTTNTQIENFNKFIGYLDKLEKKQKFKSVHRYVDFLRSCLTPLILNLTEGEEM